MRYLTSLLLSLSLLLALAGVARADDAPGTILIEQRGPDGALVAGGCYDVTRIGGGEDPGHFCDGTHSATDGVVPVEDLQAGTYRFEETVGPRYFRVNPTPFTVTVAAGGTECARARTSPRPSCGSSRPTRTAGRWATRAG